MQRFVKPPFLFFNVPTKSILVATVADSPTLTDSAALKLMNPLLRDWDTVYTAHHPRWSMCRGIELYTQRGKPIDNLMVIDVP